ncbi:unnamed protein product [Dibothriocephalus latus]|uniref:UBX domain-containing protein n=1 Tax=Dibothriocephalus latus TaxID=60516 RepID=A0A3P6TLA4_DIBLA|nr:unnamed protein product [Dibothriocephalus latus]
MEYLSRYPNVFCKLTPTSGKIVTSKPAKKSSSANPEGDSQTAASENNSAVMEWNPASVISHTASCFGPDRCLFGSGWPICRVVAPSQTGWEDCGTGGFMVSSKPSKRPPIGRGVTAARNQMSLWESCRLVEHCLEEVGFGAIEDKRKVFASNAQSAAGQRVRALTRDELPADFFTVSREDLRRLIEQQQKAQEESGMLLTKAMRERLKTRERRLYRFVLIRIRLPGELVLQGTFQASETLDDVRNWVAECLDNQAVVFKLWSPPGMPGLGRSPTARVALEDGFASLVDLGLAPCSLLTLSFEEDIAGGGGQSARTVNLRPDLLQKMQPLS